MRMYVCTHYCMNAAIQSVAKDAHPHSRLARRTKTHKLQTAGLRPCVPYVRFVRTARFLLLFPTVCSPTLSSMQTVRKSPQL
jgi:hypothetical protein